MWVAVHTDTDPVALDETDRRGDPGSDDPREMPPGAIIVVMDQVATLGDQDLVVAVPVGHPVALDDAAGASDPGSDGVPIMPPRVILQVHVMVQVAAFLNHSFVVAVP